MRGRRLAVERGGRLGDEVGPEHLLQGGVERAVGQHPTPSEHEVESLAELVAVHGSLVQQSEDCELDGVTTACHATYRTDISANRESVVAGPVPRTLWRVSAKRRADGPAQTRRPSPRRTPRQRAAKIFKILAIVGVVGALVMAGIVVVLYQAISIPTPNAAFQAQTTFVYYKDGKEQLGTYYEDQNRESIPLDEMPMTHQRRSRRSGEPDVLDRQGHRPQGHRARALLQRPRQRRVRAPPRSPSSTSRSST